MCRAPEALGAALGAAALLVAPCLVSSDEFSLVDGEWVFCEETLWGNLFRPGMILGAWLVWARWLLPRILVLREPVDRRALLGLVGVAFTIGVLTYTLTYEGATGRLGAVVHP